MTEYTRKKTEIANRRREVAERYLRGMYMSQIADELKVDTATVSRDLSELRKEWLDRSINHIDQKKAIELAKIDQLELTYWDAWERSKQNAETEITEQLGNRRKPKSDGEEQDATIIPERIKRTKRVEGQTGDPRFLDGVLKCIERRCAILGMDVKKPGDVNVNVNLDLEKWKQTAEQNARQFEEADECASQDG